jgi:hypothetical protein
MTVSPNSAKVYHGEIKGEKENGQDAIILSAFVAYGEPATARMIQKYLKVVMNRDLEVNIMSRSVNNLHPKKPARLIRLDNPAKCLVTGRVVAYYEPILKLKKVDVNGQIKLL